MPRRSRRPLLVVALVLAAFAAGGPATAQDPVDLGAICIVEDLIGQPCLTPEQRAGFDARGNRDGVFNAGDAAAFFDRTGSYLAPPAVGGPP